MSSSQYCALVSLPHPPSLPPPPHPPPPCPTSGPTPPSPPLDRRGFSARWRHWLSSFCFHITTVGVFWPSWWFMDDVTITVCYQVRQQRVMLIVVSLFLPRITVKPSSKVSFPTVPVVECFCKLKCSVALENWSALSRLLLGCHFEHDLLVWSLSQNLNINETLFGLKGRDITTAGHFPEPLKLLGLLPPILFPWILTMSIPCVIHGVGCTRSTNQYCNWHGVGQWRGLAWELLLVFCFWNMLHVSRWLGVWFLYKPLQNVQSSFVQENSKFYSD